MKTKYDPESASEDIRWPHCCSHSRKPKSGLWLVIAAAVVAVSAVVSAVVMSP